MLPELLPVIQITLPLIVTVFLATFVAAHSQNKRMDDFRADMKEGFAKVDKRIDELRIEIIALRADMNAGFEKVNHTLADHGERIARLEGRIPPLVRN